ncbi:hypothetical protein, partial [Mesorhizobium sp.]|uniref:hypothetical protein n=1 Tax=Mesorhizobium sp. TaxID=1871066 RepID=UPI0025E4CB65
QRSGKCLELLATLKIGHQMRYKMLENGYRATQDGWLGNSGHDEIDERLVERFASRTPRGLEFRCFWLLRTSGRS